MKNWHHLYFSKLRLVGLLLILVTIIFSCNQQDKIIKTQTTLPIGKWNIIQMNSADRTILFDSTRNYTLEQPSNNKLIICAEDNRLAGDMIPLDQGNFTLENITITDVCCNSEAATLLFKFFQGEIGFQQQADKLTLTANAVVITLE